jgi:hypothetical protein
MASSLNIPQNKSKLVHFLKPFYCPCMCIISFFLCFLGGGYLIMLSARLYHVRWYDYSVNDELKRSSHGLIEILSWHLCGGTEENNEKLEIDS